MNEKELGRSNIWKARFMEMEHSLHRLRIDSRGCHTGKRKVECDWNVLHDSYFKGVLHRPCKWA